MPLIDPVAKAAYQQEYRNRTRSTQRAARRMYDRAKHANERARKYGAEGTLLTAEVREVMAVGVCHYCGGTERLGIDHVIPLCDGGVNRPENLVCCCHSCNASKWRQDRPGRWARAHSSCVVCGTTEVPHLAHGMCRKCHRRERAKTEPKRPINAHDRRLNTERARRRRERLRAELGATDGSEAA